MAKEQSLKNCYPSRYSPNGFVRADQYIIELVCEKKARTQGKDLPVKFWSNPEWEKYFKSQLRRCKTLLKKYRAGSIISALQDKRAYKIYSLFAPWLEDIIKEYESRPVVTEPVETDRPDMTTGEFKRERKKNKNILDLLE